MLTRKQLKIRHCQQLPSKPAMSTQAIIEQLVALPQWKLKDGFITRTYGFSNYDETLDFVNTIALMIHRENHHPELIVNYDTCTVKFKTHSVHGITENDFICAARCDALFEDSPPSSP